MPFDRHANQVMFRLAYQQGDIMIVQVRENDIKKSKNWEGSRSPNDGPFEFMQIGEDNSEPFEFL